MRWTFAGKMAKLAMHHIRAWLTYGVLRYFPHFFEEAINAANPDASRALV
jgi:hypothetical protein